MLLALALTAAAPLAHAQQVTDEERAAARNLYFEGVKLQEAGNYPDALDKFTRAQRIFSAPTHVLRIAECQAAMFRLVEAAESYRALVKADLGKNPPAAFVQAQQQAAAELPAVEARIPSLKVDVQPPNVQNPVFTVNNQTVNSALIGVARPVNPGTHTIAVTAPGYGKAEQTVTLKEKEQRAITLTLQPGGVVYGPTPVVPVYTVPVQGQPGQQPTQQQQPDKPPEYRPDERPKPSSAGFLAGVRAGAGIPAGDLQKTSTTGTLKMGDVATPGLALGLDVGFRVATKLIIGVMYEFGTYGQADKVKQNASPSDTITTSQTSSLVNGYLGFTSNPEGTGFYGEVGFGYRWFSQSTKIVTAAGATSEGTTTARGTEFDFGLGVWVAAAPWLRIIPKVSVGIGSFSDVDNGATSASLTSDARATHTFVFLGVNGFYNLDFGKSDQAKK